MTAIADSLGNGETTLDRAVRLHQRAELFRTIAEDSWGEADRAYERAREAEQRAEEAERQYGLAYAACQAEGG